MNAVARALRWLRRRLFGRYALVEPRAIAETAPYTFFLPSENELLALAPGDLVKVGIRSHPASHDFEAERRWILLDAVDGDRLEGALDSGPLDMPQLRAGGRVRLRREHVLDILWAEPRAVAPPAAPPRRTYWERCLVDRCVLVGDAAVHFVHREEPELWDGDDAHPDSGWRIRGDYRGLSDAEIDAREVDFVAIGAVLNRDDSWIGLIDAPVGSAWVRDWATGRFVPDIEVPPAD